MESLNVPEYDLKGVKGKIQMVREVVIMPFVTIVAKGVANLTMHSKHMNVVFEPVTGYSYYITMARSYVVLRPGRGKINVCLRNHSVKQITIPKQTTVGEIAAANVIPALLALKPIENESNRGQATPQQGKSEGQEEPLKIDLTGL